jgi:hypothetical protein
MVISMPNEHDKPIDRVSQLASPTNYTYSAARDPDSDDALPIADAEGPSAARRQFESMMNPDEPSAPTLPHVSRLSYDDDARFSLMELFALVTVASLGLAGVRWLPRAYFAGVLGLLAVAAILLSAFRVPRSRVARTLNWCLIVMYLAASAGAFLAGLWETE